MFARMSDLHVLLLMVLAGKTAFGVSVLFKYLVLRGSEVIRKTKPAGPGAMRNFSCERLMLPGRICPDFKC